MSTVGSRPHARAWTAVDRPISPPSRQTWALLAMFCDLERGDAEAVLLEDPAEGGDERGLAHAAAGPLDHDGGHERMLFSGAPYRAAQAGLLAPG